MVPVRVPICLISLIWPIKAGAKDTKAPDPLKAAKRIYSTLPRAGSQRARTRMVERMDLTTLIKIWRQP